jgi:hypothetical protein
VTVETAGTYGKFVAMHPVVLLGVLPIAVLYVIASNIDGSHLPLVRIFEQSIAFFVWWLGLGQRDVIADVCLRILACRNSLVDWFGHWNAHWFAVSLPTHLESQRGCNRMWQREL